MNLIVNTRYNERRLTIFTSNYEDMPDDSDPNSLLFRIGFRMRSRLHEMCEFLEYRRRRTTGAAAERRRRGYATRCGRDRRSPETAGAGIRPARAQLREPACATAKPTLKWPGGRAEVGRRLEADRRHECQ